MNFIQENWLNILALVGALDGVFYIVTKMTKSTKDDNIYTLVHNFVVKFFPKGK